MKKLFLVLSIVFSVATFAQAQTATFGIRGGANISNLSGDLQNEDLFRNKIGFHAGATLNFTVIGNFLSIQPELLYSVKGFRYDDDITILNRRYEGSVNYNYLDLPVLARIKAGPLYFEAGPQASYLLSVNNKTKTFVNNELQSTQVSKGSKEGLSDFEVGYAAGIGLAAANGISVGLRYNGSFTDFVKEDVNFGGSADNARHSVIMLTLGYSFGR
ncbi:PorT family protein [Pontibacter qinzhouensis]|uniref:PorT family protein n=1 Tax=Pontibacter qinzhouensis TaxID=2603253 RepID=A0A5C8JH04_9BACT|nr:porin family protein [Pontibacter qinzhouensis]TXK36671.1 PorT family protein [Pontibacter qinzhouensis]